MGVDANSTSFPGFQGIREVRTSSHHAVYRYSLTFYRLRQDTAIHYGIYMVNIEHASLATAFPVGINPVSNALDLHVALRYFQQHDCVFLSCSPFVVVCFLRHLGSSKYGSFLVLAAVLTKSFELALCIQFPNLRQPSGPFSILSALTTIYYGMLYSDTPCQSCDQFDVAS